MADIDVVKKSSHAWVWIVVILVLALVAWFLLAGNHSTTTGQLQHGGQPHIAAVLTA